MLPMYLVNADRSFQWQDLREYESIFVVVG